MIKVEKQRLYEQSHSWKSAETEQNKKAISFLNE